MAPQNQKTCLRVIFLRPLIFFPRTTNRGNIAFTKKFTQSLQRIRRTEKLPYFAVGKIGTIDFCEVILFNFSTGDQSFHVVFRRRSQPR